MTLTAFRQLLPTERVRLTIVQGTFPGRRAGPAGGFHLYHVPNAGLGFFVELSFGPALAAIVIVRSFVRTELLTDYVAEICVPTSL